RASLRSCSVSPLPRMPEQSSFLIACCLAGQVTPNASRTSYTSILPSSDVRIARRYLEPLCVAFWGCGMEAEIHGEFVLDIGNSRLVNSGQTDARRDRSINLHPPAVGPLPKNVQRLPRSGDADVGNPLFFIAASR